MLDHRTAESKLKLHIVFLVFIEKKCIFTKHKKTKKRSLTQSKHGYVETTVMLVINQMKLFVHLHSHLYTLYMQQRQRKK
jgi:hypothetical protein